MRLSFEGDYLSRATNVKGITVIILFYSSAEAKETEEKEETEASTGKSASAESSQNASKENSKKGETVPIAEEPEKV